MLNLSSSFEAGIVKISNLIDQLGGVFNVFDYMCHSNDIFVIIRDIAWIENTNLIFDAYEIKWINKNVVHIKITENSEYLNEVFKKCLSRE